MMVTNLFKGIELSSEVKERRIKFMFWGGTGTRKTETILRYFPNVFLVDTEGNSDPCIGMEEIPPFLRYKTKDVRVVLDLFDACAKGQITFPDGRLVKTFAVDSESVLWNVQADVAAKIAEEKALRYHKNPEDALITLQDWGKVKRPIKSLHTRFANSSIPFMVLTAREKDLMEEVVNSNGNKELKKTGVVPEAVKGAEYEFNAVLHFGFEDSARTRWLMEVTKVQGKLSAIFPSGKKLNKWPASEVIAYAAQFGTSDVGSTKEDDEGDLAGKIAREEVDKNEPRTKQRLIEIGANLGLTPTDVGKKLDNAGLSFDPDRWQEMVAALNK